jgi:UDP-N-acetylglucosamine transferase subunit ALG13
MILVTVGTNEARFDRLLQLVDELHLDEELVVQHGPSSVRPHGATTFDFLPFDELAEQIRRARVVVTHAGVGSVMASLANGKRPVVVPRLHRLGEAVDDHQLDFARRAASDGLLVLAEDAPSLREAVAGEASHAGVEMRADPRLVAELRDVITRATGA